MVFSKLQLTKANINFSHFAFVKHTTAATLFVCITYGDKHCNHRRYVLYKKKIALRHRIRNYILTKCTKTLLNYTKNDPAT